MSDVEVSAWGRRSRSFDSTPPPSRAFTNADYSRLISAVETLAHTQLGHLLDDFTADELRQLYCPEVYRSSFTQTYSVENDNAAKGVIYLDLLKVLRGAVDAWNVFEEPKARVLCDKLTLRTQFDRSVLPDGFVTPDPIFGTHLSPVTGLRGIPPAELHERFVSMMVTLTQVTAEWTAVRWVLEQLHQCLKTPQQVRYVWPAIYTLATTAGLQWAPDVANASARAGNNASTSSAIMPFLKPTYEVVARSVLLNADQGIASRYRAGQMRMVTSMFLLSADGVGDIAVTGV